MTEGSDGRLSILADTSAINHGARVQRARRVLEEWRVTGAPLLADPGEDHPSSDAAPPFGEAHPEYETLPPP